MVKNDDIDNLNKKRLYRDIFSDRDLENLEKKIRCIIFKNLYTDILARNITTKFKLDKYLNSLVNMFQKTENDLKKEYKKYFENNKELTDEEHNYIGEIIIINKGNKIRNKVR